LRDERNRARVGKKSARRSPIRSASARLFAATNGIWMGRVISIAGEPYWLWSAVDQNGFVLDVLVQRRRDSRAAQQLMRSLLKSAVTPPRVMITDKLRSYGAARAQDGPLRRTSPAQGPEQSHRKLLPADKATRMIMKRFNRPGRRNDFCRFTIKSRTSSTSLIPNPSLPTSAVRRASEPLRFGARSPRRALRPRASCFWVYAYPAFLRYAAHSAGGYWARILPQASEIARSFAPRPFAAEF
jgi:IS1 family transposase